MRNIRLVIEYDGTQYAGWQRQDRGRSIQAELEGALARILQEPVSVIGAGRTDAGVHARGQVANFRTTSQRNDIEIVRGLNGLLPEDITVLEAREVPLEFHSRYSAKERSYSYTITRTPSALLRDTSWFVKFSLNVSQMRWAACQILGEHDFQSFCKVNTDVEHHRCEIYEAGWSEHGNLLVFSIRANRFLHGMVRALVGTMVDVGRGYTTLEDFLSILHSKDRTRAGMAAPAKGLVLERVTY